MPRELLVTILSSIGVFVLILSIWIMVVIIVASRSQRRTKMVEHRLGLTPDGPEDGRTIRLWLDGKEVETAVGRETRADLSTRFATMCLDAGWELPPHTILLGVMGAMCAAFVVLFTYSGNAMVSGASSLLVVIFFWIFLQQRIQRRRTLFENQLIDALELAARSLRVGHPLVNALRLVSEEVAAPIGPMFAGIVQQQELGVSMEDAIRSTADASSSEDLKLFATAVIIQLRSGGNLADMMERVSSVMRDRLRLGRRVRVLITQAQFSKQILLALPMFMFLMLNWLNPEYMKPLYNTYDGWWILGSAIGLVMIGVLIMNRLAAVRY